MALNSPRIRQEKRSPDEIRALLLEAGEQILTAPQARGIMTALTLTAVFEKIQSEQGIRLTNASVIGRVFDSVEHFRREVLLRVAAGESEDFSAASDHVFRKVILKADLSTPEKRWTALKETCRVSANFMQESLQKSPTWRLWLGILAYAIADPKTNEDLVEALRLSYQRLDQQSHDTYSVALAILGFREIEAGGLDLFSFWAETLGEGIGIRSLVEPESMKMLSLPTGPDGKRQKWSKFAIAYWSLIQHTVEIDPDWKKL